MSRKPKCPAITFHANVLERVRRHAKRQLEVEICGILVGQLEGGVAIVQDCIEGDHASHGETHVTFTQDTWEHIYRIKDQQHADQKILGWYHSHPGFGVFLSEYDIFIHEHFFPAHYQVAWVYDPKSEEEGCFGWLGTKVERLKSINVVDPRAETVKVPRTEPELRPEPSPPPSGVSARRSPLARLREALIGTPEPNPEAPRPANSASNDPPPSKPT